MRALSSIVGCVVAGAVIGVVSGAGAAEPALWLRYPCISPDGSKIVLSYQGDLWEVPVSGGEARALTLHQAYEYMPVFSPDGTTIAFASNRYGNFDIFVMPAGGGAAQRLTFHSADDHPTSFSPDGTAVLFVSGRLDDPACVQFPHPRAQPELYRVPVAGGMPTQVLTTPAEYAVFNHQGSLLAYSDLKGYESQWRKHDDSSFARDVWVYDVTTGVHRRLTEAGYDDRQPVWAPDGRSLFYLSEQSGTFNVFKLSLDDAAAPEQLTFHDTHPVRFLSVSAKGDLCYTYDGEVWVMPAGAAAGSKLTVYAAADTRGSETQWTDVAGSISEIDVSPDGKEIAFIARGEVFVTSVEYGDTKRITDTPEQERSLSFAPDGKSLLYASERDGSWNLYRTNRSDAEEAAFFNATTLEEVPVLVSSGETFQPRFSPDGKEVAYLEERTELKVLNLSSGQSRTIVSGESSYSYTDGDQWYAWSPDGRWFVIHYLSPNRWSYEVGLVPSSGSGELANISTSGYEDYFPTWALKGEMLIWFSDRFGKRSHGGWGSYDDVFATFLNAKAFDRFHLSRAELEQLKAREEEEKKKQEEVADDKKGKGKRKKGKDETAVKDDGPRLAEPVKVELDDIKDRTLRLTTHSAALAGAALTSDGEKLLYLAKFEKGYDLWSWEHRKQEIKLLAKLKAKEAGELQIDKEDKKAFVLADGHITSIEIEGGKTKSVALQAKMELRPQQERAYFFEHAWRQTLEKFYDQDMHGVDWQAYKQAYARFLPHVTNGWDFAELLSELQGELNASHLGCGYRLQDEEADATASLAFFPDASFEGDGIKIAEVIDKSPLLQADARITAGVIITAINGTTIRAGSNWYPMLNHAAGELIRLDLLDPQTSISWHVRVKPISLDREARLLYERWVKTRRDEVERLSQGRIGYAHIRSMSDRYYREIFEQIFGKASGKQAIVLDTRFNNGGNLVESLTVFLSGKVYARNISRGREIGVEPALRWTKPSIVVMNEGNYSDAHCFPAAYTALGLGETVGMPVPGTCTSVWWETLQDKHLYFGIPQVGMIDPDGELLENKHLQPDYEVDNDPGEEARGRDQQLEKAVELLLEQLGGE